MTQEERVQHRNRMRAMTREEERQRYRPEHHEQILERARAQGRIPPYMMKEGGRGVGSGGGGAGPGGGMGMGGGFRGGR